jgi:uncharacterized protein YciW
VALIEDPHEVVARWPDPRRRMIAELAAIVTTSPWTLTREHLSRAHSATLSDEDVLHVIALSSYFGHLNRIADVVAVPLDYPNPFAVPPPDREVAPWPSAPKLLARRPAIDLGRRPLTQTSLTEWKSYIFYRDTPLTRRQRTLLARWVATWLGDGGISPPTDLTANQHDDALRIYAELVTLAPWRIGNAELAALRILGWDDATIFDATATISSAGVFSRIEVALASLAS